MREPYRSSNIGREGLEAGVLLAYDAQGCNRLSQKMQKLPGTC